MTRIVKREKPYAIIYGLPLDPQMDTIFEDMIEQVDKTFVGQNLNIRLGSVIFLAKK